MNHIKNALCYSSIVIHDKSSDLYTIVSTSLPAETLQAVITEANKKSSYMKFSFKATFQSLGDQRVQNIFERVLSSSQLSFPDFYRSASQALYYQALESGNPPPYSLNSPIYRGWAHTKLSKQLNESSISCRKQINAIPSGAEKDTYISQVAAILKTTPVHPLTLKACCLHINGIFPSITPQEIEVALCDELETIPHLSILDPAFQTWANSTPRLSSQEKATSNVLTNYIRTGSQLATIEMILKNIHRITRSGDIHPATLKAVAIQLSYEFKSSKLDNIEKKLYENIPLTLSSSLYNHHASRMSKAEQQTSEKLAAFCSSLQASSTFFEAASSISSILKGEEINPLTLKALINTLQKRFPDSSPEDLFLLLFMPIGSSLYRAWASLFLEDEEKECSEILIDLFESSYESLENALTLIGDRLEGEAIHPITLCSLEKTLETTFTTSSTETISSKLGEYLIMPVSSPLYRTWANAHLQGKYKESSDLIVSHYNRQETLSDLVSHIGELPIHPITFKALISDLKKVYREDQIQLKKNLALAFPMRIESDLYAVFAKSFLKGEQKETSDRLIAFFSAKSNSESKQELLALLTPLLQDTHPSTIYSLHLTLEELFSEYEHEELYEALSMPITSPLYDTWAEVELSGDQKKSSDTLVTLLGNVKHIALPQIASLLKDRDIHPLTLKSLFVKLKELFQKEQLKEFYQQLDMPLGSYRRRKRSLYGFIKAYEGKTASRPHRSRGS
jgi:hypothetical protein